MIFLATKWLWVVFGFIALTVMGLFLVYVSTKRQLAPIHPDSLYQVYPLSFYKLRWRLLLIGIGLTGISILLLRPAILVTSRTMTLPKMDIVFVVDISPSMRTRDLQPDRLEYAKAQIAQLVHQLGQYRMALVMFSGEAILQTPMTPDPASVLAGLESLSPDSITAKGTNIEDALLSARGALATSPPSFRKIVILVTDGEDHGSGLQSVLDQLKKDNIRVYSIGIGTSTGAPIPVFDDQGQVVDYKKTSDGRTVVSKMDPALLALISKTTEGQAFVLGQEQADWRGLLAQIQRLKSGKAKQRISTVDAREIQALILFPSLLFILLGLAIPIRLAPLVFLLFMVINTDGSFASEQYNLPEAIRNKIANAEVRSKKYPNATSKYMKNMATIPRSGVTHYNLGNVLMLSGRPQEAQSEWAQAVNAKPSKRLGSHIAFNQAQQFIQSGEYDKAQSSLVQALKLLPADKDAKKNLEMALLELKRKQQNKPGQSTGPSKGNGGGEPKKSPTGGTGQPAQGRFSKDQSEQILDSMMNNKMLQPKKDRKRQDDEQDW